MNTKILLIAALALLIQSCYQGQTPKRLPNIPENAVWKGSGKNG